MNAELGSLDPYKNVRRWTRSVAGDWAEALESRARSQVELRTRLVDLAALRPGDVAVEIGSGTGELLLDLAKRVGPNGSVIGVEPQSKFAELSRAKLSTVGTPHEIIEASAEHIPIVDRAANAVLAQTVLIHLPLPTANRALREMARITQPGGHLVSVDHDGDTWIIDHPDRDTTRKLITFNSDQRFADGWRGRQLRRLFLEMGLADVAVQPWVHVDTDRPSYLYQLAERIASAAALAGVITELERGAWVEALAARADGGLFFSSITFYIAVGRRPEF